MTATSSQLWWLNRNIAGRPPRCSPPCTPTRTPANRYPEIAPEVRAICEKYGLPYNTGGLTHQIASTWKKIAKLSLPNSWTADDVEFSVKVERQKDAAQAS